MKYYMRKSLETGSSSAREEIKSSHVTL